MCARVRPQTLSVPGSKLDEAAMAALIASVRLSTSPNLSDRIVKPVLEHVLQGTEIEGLPALARVVQVVEDYVQATLRSDTTVSPSFSSSMRFTPVLQAAAQCVRPRRHRLCHADSDALYVVAGGSGWECGCTS